jgi:hypothetical protein
LFDNQSYGVHFLYGMHKFFEFEQLNIEIYLESRRRRMRPLAHLSFGIWNLNT